MLDRQHAQIDWIPGGWLPEESTLYLSQTVPAPSLALKTPHLIKPVQKSNYFWRKKIKVSFSKNIFVTKM